eukprot:10946370-Ditylum_brightwellii.AAC.1
MVLTCRDIVKILVAMMAIQTMEVQIQRGGVLALSFGGYCTRCRTNHNLPSTDEARQAALDLRDRMVRSGRIDIDELPIEQQERLFMSSSPSLSTSSCDESTDLKDSTTSLAEEMGLDPNLALSKLYERRGKMFGVLVCDVPQQSTDVNTKDVVILKAYAGKLGGEWNLPGWAPLVGKVPETIPEFCRLSAEVTQLFERIDNVTATKNEGNGNNDDNSNEIQALIQERAKLSTRAIHELRSHQLVTNFRGETVPITAAFARGPTRLPGGTGDCAAPKLLAEAVRRGLYPRGICEIFIGATGGMSTTKNDGTFYDA